MIDETGRQTDYDLFGDPYLDECRDEQARSASDVEYDIESHRFDRETDAADDERRENYALALSNISFEARVFLAKHAAAVSVTVRGEFYEVDADVGVHAGYQTETRVDFRDGSYFARNGRGQLHPVHMFAEANAYDAWEACEELADAMSEHGATLGDDRGVMVTREAVRET